MKWKWILSLIVIVPALNGLLFASDEGPGRKFEARVEVSGPQGTRSMVMVLDIRRFTPVEEARALAKTVGVGGQSTLASLIRVCSDGQIKLGAMTMPVGVVVAQKLEDDNYRYIIVSARRTRVNEENFGSDSLDYPFSVSTFVAGEWTSEDGAFYPAAKIHLDPEDGTLTIEQYKIEPGTIDQIKRLQ